MIGSSPKLWIGRACVDGTAAGFDDAGGVALTTRNTPRPKIMQYLASLDIVIPSFGPPDSLRL
jgi:hypothetical protein